jgi:hypothetical protein
LLPEKFAVGGILHQDCDAFGLAEVGQEAHGPEELIVRVLREATEVHVTELRDPLRGAEYVQQRVEEGFRFVTEGNEGND